MLKLSVFFCSGLVNLDPFYTKYEVNYGKCSKITNTENNYFFRCS